LRTKIRNRTKSVSNTIQSLSAFGRCTMCDISCHFGISQWHVVTAPKVLKFRLVGSAPECRSCRRVHRVSEQKLKRKRCILASMTAIPHAAEALTSALDRFEQASTRLLGAVSGVGDGDAGEQLVEITAAKMQFSAGVALIRFSDEMWSALMDI